ncbi:MAG: hypothetical protein IJ679_03925 [Lachnospiraceae bacterium]|nr:hypothetical protein [Lachnospiraceae bacterium]
MKQNEINDIVNGILESMKVSRQSIIIRENSLRTLSIVLMIRDAFELRGNADYKDFYIVSKTQAEEQIESAQEVLGMIKPYLEKQWSEAKISP